MSTVGHPRREEELAELDRLIRRYPDQARGMLSRIVGP